MVVTGSSGFIGARLSAALIAAGCAVTEVDILPPRDPRAGWRPVNIITDDLDPLLARAGVVYHLAARPGVRSSWTSAADYLRTNVLGTQRVVEACLRSQVPRLVIASSSSVYGEWPGRPARESDTPAPRSPYAVTKLAAEQLARAYALRPDSRLTVVALRLFTVYGPGQRPDMLIERLLQAACTGQPVTLFGSAEQARDFTYVDDVVAALCAAGRADLTSCLVNVGTGRSTSLHDLLDMVSSVTGATVRWTGAPSQPGDVTRTQADLDLASTVLGYRPVVSLPDGIRRQWQFFARRRPAAREENRDALPGRIVD